MRFATIALVLLVLAGCTSLAPKPPPSLPDPQTQMSPLALRIAILVEEQRIKLDPKAKALAIDPELTKIAQARASDMAAKNYLAHTAPTGETSATLLMADDAKWQGLLGENLAAQHYLKESGVDVITFAARFLEEWMKSAPHRDNLAYPAYDRTGVGAAVNGDTVYVAQLFASDMGLKPPPDDDAPGKITSYASPMAAQKDSSPPPPIRLRGSQGLN